MRRAPKQFQTCCKGIAASSETNDVQQLHLLDELQAVPGARRCPVPGHWVRMKLVRVQAGIVMLIDERLQRSLGSVGALLHDALPPPPHNPPLAHLDQLACTCFRDVSPYASGHRCVVTGATSATRFSGGAGREGPLAAGVHM